MASVRRTGSETSSLSEAPKNEPVGSLTQKVSQVAARRLEEGSLQPVLFAQDGASGGFSALPSVIEAAQDYSHRNGSPKVATHGEKVQAGELGGATIVNGITTIALGVLQAQRGVATLQTAAETQDSTAARIGFTRVIRAPADVTRGAANVAKGTASIVDATTKVSKAAQAVSIAGKIASAGSLVTATMLMAMCASYLHETRVIHKDMNKEGTAVDKVKYLQNLRELNEPDQKKVVNTLLTGGQTGSLVTRLAAKLFGPKEDIKTKALKVFLKDPKDQSALEVLKRELGQGTSAYTASGWMRDEIDNFVDGRLGIEHDEAFVAKLKGALQELCQGAIDNELERKRNVFGRAVGSDAVKALDACDVNTVLESDAQAIVKTAEAGFVRSQALMSVGIFLCILWIGLVIAAFVVTGGVSGIIEAVVGLTISTLSAGLDGYYLYQEYKEKKLVGKDKLFLFSMSLITTIGAVLATAAFKTTVGKVTGGLSSLAWLGFLLWTIWGRKSEGDPAPRPGTLRDDGYDSGIADEQTPLLSVT